MKDEIKNYIDKSILCWLATASVDGIPNVSPKEIFTHHDGKMIIANIASPLSEKNIRENPNVCVSFIDIFVQKGFQVKGIAHIIKEKSSEFNIYKNILIKMTDGKYPFSNIFKIEIKSFKPIIAPKYILYPLTTEAEQIESAKKSYGLN